eukprot:Partr_v1_DN23246_c0_g1_i1_m35435 putative ribosomal protein
MNQAKDTAVKAARKHVIKPDLRAKVYQPHPLVNVYRRAYPASPKPTVPNVASKPFGIQQQVYLNVLDDQAMSGKPYISPLQKLTFNYCDLGGSSKHMREFITKDLVKFAHENPQCEIQVQPRPYHHPLIRAEYDNGFTKTVCVRNLEPMSIMQHVKQYRDSHGISPIKPKFPVLTRNESPRGIWTPFKDPQVRPTHKPQPPRHLYSNNF